MVENMKDYNKNLRNRFKKCKDIDKLIEKLSKKKGIKNMKEFVLYNHLGYVQRFTFDKLKQPSVLYTNDKRFAEKYTEEDYEYLKTTQSWKHLLSEYKKEYI